MRDVSQYLGLQELALYMRWAKRYLKIKNTNWQRRLLARLQETSELVLSSNNQQEILERITQVVQESGFDRARLYLLEGEYLTGYAQKGMDNQFVGVRWPVTEDEHWAELQRQPRAQIFRRTAGWPTHSEARLDRADVQEWACVPLIVRQQLLGQIAADNKFSRRPINEAELLPLSLFASQAVAAIEKVHLLDEADRRAQQLRRQEQFKALLVNTMPHALIANDPQGRITIFNEQAATGLGYTETEAKDLESVKHIYFRPEKARQIRRQLDQLGPEPLTDYYTDLRAKDGQRIPVRLSARRLTNSDGQIITVGYYEDLRELKKYQDRLDLVLQAVSLVAQAQDLAEGLQNLAEMLSQLYPDTFCRILLRDESENVLNVAAAAFPHGVWKPDLREQYDLDRYLEEYPKLQAWLEQAEPRIIRRKYLGDVDFLERLRKKLELKQPIYALLVIPLKLEERIVGLLTLGALCEQNEIRREEIRPAVAIATQTTILIDRLQGYKRQERIMEALQETSQHIQKTTALPFMYKEIARLAANIVGYDVGGLFINQPQQERLELQAVYGLPTYLISGVVKHQEVLLGHVARTGKPGLLNDYDVRVQHEGLFGPFNLKTVIGVPLGRTPDEVSAVLFVANTTKRTAKTFAPGARGVERFERTDLQELQRFAKQAWLALQMAQQLDREQRTFRQLATFHEISDYLQQVQDQQLMLHAILTGVTAGYGLGFNRAVILELTEDNTVLVTALGLGQETEEEAKRVWEEAERLQYNSFTRYREALKSAGLTTTSLAERLAGLRLPYRPESDDAFSRALQQRTLQRIEPAEFDRLPETFRKLFQPTSPLVIVPLFANERPLGLLVADRKFNQLPISEEELSLLGTFTSSAAALLDKAHRLQESRRSYEQAVAFYRRSSELVALQNPKLVLHAVVEKLREVAKASVVHLILLDEFERVEQTITVGLPEYEKRDLKIRPNGVSLEVFRNSRAMAFPDTQREPHLNPKLIGQARSAVCLPLSLPSASKKGLGVVWIHYDNPRQFEPFEVDTLQLYVNQVAIAYDNARALEKLAQIREEFAQANDLDKLLEQLKQRALDVLRADAVIFWFFDEERGDFDHTLASATGLSPELWQKYQQIGYRRIAEGASDTAKRLLEEGWLAVGDLADPDERAKLGPTTLSLLDDFEARSFQGIALYDGRHKSGVVYALYKQPCLLGEHEHEMAGILGRETARTWKNAQLLNQAQKAYRAAEAVARITGDRYSSDTLKKIVHEIKHAIEADAVVLFEYRQLEKKLQSPIAEGVRWPERLVGPAEARDYPLVEQILRLDAPRIVEDVPREPDFCHRRFAREEAIKSCLAVPLKAAGQRVGVLFINYRCAHHFIPDELQTIQLLAHQAAGALSYLQQTVQSAMSHSPALDHAQRERERRVLQELSVLFHNARTLQETLESAVLHAAQVLELDGCTIVLPDQLGDLRVRAQVGWPPEVFNGQVFQPGRESQTGYTILRRDPVIVKDYGTESDFKVPEVVTRHGMETGVSVPLKREPEPLGALLAYSKQKGRVFTEEEVWLLQLIADQTILAMRRTERYESLHKLFIAVHETSRNIAAGESDEQRQLNEIVQTAVEMLNANPPRKVVGTLQRFDPERNELVFISSFPLETFAEAAKEQAVRWSLDRDQVLGGRIGITGEAVLTKSAQLVGDVRQNPNYRQLYPDTRSELAVPLLYQNAVIGVIDVESDQLNAFGDDDLHALQTLAEQAVIAILNARRSAELSRKIEELEEARKLVNTYTGLAWAGIAGNSWSHIVRRQAANIANRVELLRLCAEKYLSLDRLPDWLTRQLNVIALEAANIQTQTMPVIPPLSSEEAPTRMNVNELVVERLAQLRQNEPQSPIKLVARPAASGPLMVNASSEWLRRVLDILLDNAMDEVRELAPTRRQISVSTSLTNGWVEIAVDDLGRGIPPKLRSQLFKVRIDSSKGSGVGLLMVNAIIEAYGGTISLRDKEGPGTCVVIRLPHHD